MEPAKNKDNISCHFYKEYLEKYGRKYYPLASKEKYHIDCITKIYYQKCFKREIKK